MRVAVPLFGEEVAPRFCFAEQMLVAEVEDGAVATRTRVGLGAQVWSERLSLLADSGIDVLLCGGFPRRYESFASSVGINVIAGLAGRAEKLVDAYAVGEIERWMVLPGGRHRGARARHGVGRHGRRGSSPHGGRK